MRRRPPDERFWEKVDAADCWDFTGALTAKGYGSFRVEGKSISAHRYAYETLVGPIPVGLQLDHLCRNRACVNPDHLQIVSPLVNTRRGHSFAARYGKRTHCKNGHAYTPENTGIRKDSNSRYCRACLRVSSMRVRAEHRRQLNAKRNAPVLSHKGA